MNCFCALEFDKQGLGVTEIEFEDGLKHCENWLTDLTISKVITIGGKLIVVTINIVAEFIFH